MQTTDEQQRTAIPESILSLVNQINGIQQPQEPQEQIPQQQTQGNLAATQAGLVPRQSAAIQPHYNHLQAYHAPVYQQQDKLALIIPAALCGTALVVGGILIGMASSTANQPNQSIQTLAEANAVQSQQIAELAQKPRAICILSPGCGVPQDQPQPQPQQPIIPAGTPDQVKYWNTELANYDQATLADSVPVRSECINNPGLKEAFQQTTGIEPCLDL